MIAKVGSPLPHVVVMGGGTGTFPVIQALRHLPVHVTCVIGVSDSGGSTGRIRDEFGFQPVGDLRQSLAALAEEQDKAWIRKLLLYRFDRGSGFKGHNLGNVILTALQDMTGSTTKALEVVSSIFRLRGRVLPVTMEQVQLGITYSDGTQVIGEHYLDETQPAARKVTQVWLQPEATINPAAATAIKQADMIIVGPGDHFGSIMAVLMAKGIPQAFRRSHATLVYVVNLMTRRSQTSDLTAHDLVTAVESRITSTFDAILINQGSIPKTILARYQREGEFPVIDDLATDPRVIRASLVAEQPVTQHEADALPRSLLRHEPTALSSIFDTILHNHAGT